jgi:hypothetical protein
METDGKASPSTPHKRVASFGQYSQSPAAEQGTANITIVSASGFKEDTKLEIKVLLDSPKGLKEVLKTKAVKAKTGEATYDNESRKVPCNADNQFRIHAYDAHTFGSDEDLGEGTFFINDQSSGGSQEVKVGPGSVVVQSSFLANDDASNRPGSSMAPDSPAAKNRNLGRLLTKRERSVTPSG